MESHVRKNLIKQLSAALMLISSPLLSEFEDDIYSQEHMIKPDKQAGAFRLVGNFDVVGKADIDKKGYKGQDVEFSSIGAEAGAVVLYSICNREALFLAVGYSHQKIDWDENPYFDQDEFDTASLAIRFYSNRLKDWVWQGQIAINGDIEHYDFGRYTNYDLLLWGKYEWSCNFNLHAGFFMETGMRIDRIYPIIGFDWKFADDWMLNAVFPTNISLEYTYDCNWTAALAMRFFDVRHRVGEDEPLPRALVAYRNSGTELSVTYLWDPYLEANLHAGWTLGGKLRISDKLNHHPKHFKLDSSGYFGGEMIVKF